MTLASVLHPSSAFFLVDLADLLLTRGRIPAKHIELVLPTQRASYGFHNFPEVGSHDERLSA